MADDMTTNQADHVFTKDEAVNTLSSFIDSLTDDVKASIDPAQLTNLQKVSDAIVQAYSRIDQLNQTVENLQKVSEDYKAKIASYAADQAQRMKQATEEKEDVNPAVAAEQAVEASMDE